jgi:CHASE2 domain-containing sensor protein
MIKFWLHSVFVTVFVFLLLLLVNAITDLKLFSAFDPVSQALGQFELTNQVFSRLREDPEKIDERVVLVNIGRLPRGGVAQELSIINKYKPKVIGIDSYFDCEGGLMDSVNCPQLLDTLGNLLLSDAIQQAGNVVLVSKLLPKTSTSKNPDADHFYDSMEVSDPMFQNFAEHGFANLPTDADYQEDVKYCNSLITKYEVNGKMQYAFSVKLAMIYDSIKAMKFLARNNEEELINFRGNAETLDVKLKTLRTLELEQSHFRVLCYQIDIKDVLTENFDPSLFKDKIVIMGFLGKQFGDPAWEDKFFTPLNKSVAGRANPDMFGPVIHANSIIMILNEDYINQLEEWQKYAIASILCILTVALFKVIDDKLPIWYDALSVIVQIVEILIISGMVVWVFKTSNIKLDLTLSMAVIALVGPCYDLLKPLQTIAENWLTKRRERVLTPKI